MHYQSNAFRCARQIGAARLVDNQSRTAAELYDAECALHAAHQSHVDAWISAAGDKLHQAVTDHLAAITAHNSTDRP